MKERHISINNDTNNMDSTEKTDDDKEEEESPERTDAAHQCNQEP